MAEYIEREAVMKAIDAERDRLVALDMIGAEHILAHNARRIIEDFPAADVVERKRGEWIELTTAAVKCSQCSAIHAAHSTYCPNCGADMRGEVGRPHGAAPTGADMRGEEHGMPEVR